MFNGNSLVNLWGGAIKRQRPALCVDDEKAECSSCVIDGFAHARQRQLVEPRHARARKLVHAALRHFTRRPHDRCVGAASCVLCALPNFNARERI